MKIKTRWELEQEKERRKRASRVESILLIIAIIIAIIAVIFVPVPTRGASEVKPDSIPSVVYAEEEKPTEIVADDELEYYKAVLNAQKPTVDDQLAGMVGTVIASDTPEEDEADDQFELLCQIVMDEGGHTEPDDGIRMIADGVLNRMDDPRFPDTIEGVINQPGQFQPVSDGAFYKWVPTERVIQICAEEMEHRTNTKVLFWRTGHYHAGTTPIAHIGHHYYSGF